MKNKKQWTRQESIPETRKSLDKRYAKREQGNKQKSMKEM